MSNGVKTPEAEGKGSGTPDDPDIQKRKTNRLQKQAMENAKGATIADRLTRHAATQMVNLTFTDNEGDFIIELRSPTRKELDKLLKLQNALQDTEKQEKSSIELYTLLDDLCQDPSLDFDFWNEGNYSMEDFIQVFTKLFQEYTDQVEEVENFRQK